MMDLGMQMTEEQQELIINKLKEIASEKTCYEMYGEFYDGIPQPTTRIFTDGIDYGKINLCRELLKLLETKVEPSQGHRRKDLDVIG